MRSCAYGDRSSSPGFRLLALHQAAVFANQQVQVFALLVGELQEDALALGLFKPIAVTLEELMGAALALDPDQERLTVIDALFQLSGAGCKQSVGRSLEE